MATYSEPGYEGGGGSGSVPVPLPSFLGMGHVTGQDFAGITALSAGKRKEEDTRERERERVRLCHYLEKVVRSGSSVCVFVCVNE